MMVQNRPEITNNEAWDNLNPSFSPDGTKIAFTSERDGNNEIYIMNSDGSEQTRLTNNSADDWLPSFSPDGDRRLSLRLNVMETVKSI